MLNLVRIWIVLSAFLVIAGWALSAIHELNRMGYLAALVCLGIAASYYWRNTRWPAMAAVRTGLRKLFRRCRRPAPLLFALLVLLALVSGLLYAPYNSDTYSYRLPRIFHWLAEERWHWIHTADMRMNVIATGYEWLAAPLILFTRTDRWLFLINWVSFLMMPGLIFPVLRRFGVRMRVAWWWTWVLASGWCYVAQAASVSNDAYGLVYSLAAVTLAVKSRESGKMSDFWLSVLAAALLTGVKQTNIPLVALWAVAAAPLFWSALRKPIELLAVLLSGFLVSAMPIMLLNLKFTGTLTGLSAILAETPGRASLELSSPFWGVVGNAFCLPVQNLLPPFFPFNHAWNRSMAAFLQTPFGSHFQSFEGFGTLASGVSEATAGIGLAITLFTVISLMAARKLGRGQVGADRSRGLQMLRLLPWLLLLVFMAKVGAASNARYLAPYYVFFFPLLLGGIGQPALVRRVWWQRLALLCMVSSVGLLVVNTKRPLFPAKTILQRLVSAYPESHGLVLLHSAYTDSIALLDLRRQLQSALPAEEKLVGYAAVGNAESEMALWLPLGAHRVEWVLWRDTPEQLAERGIRTVVIHDYPSLDCKDIHEWAARYHATLVTQFPFHGHIVNDASLLSQIYVMRLNRP